jgi:hypothetical protein
VPLIDQSALQRAVVFREPFPFLIAQQVLAGEALKRVQTDFPEIDRPGLYPLSVLSFGPAFGAVVDELLAPAVERALEHALDVKLAGRERMVTVRGRCRARDGRIHTDNPDKLAAALLYLNTDWHAEGGRLRMLRCGYDIDNVVAEVPPEAGTLVAFKRSDNSWHGHKPFAGERRYIMINWMTRPAAAERELARHRLSAQAKSLAAWWS